MIYFKFKKSGANLQKLKGSGRILINISILLPPITVHLCLALASTVIKS